MDQIYKQLASAMLRPSVPVNAGKPLIDEEDDTVRTKPEIVNIDVIAQDAPSEEVAQATEAVPAEPVPAEAAAVTDTNDHTAQYAATLKKADLVALVQKLHGEDADVSGTKQDIINRYFA